VIVAEPEAKLGFVHVRVPTVQVQPPVPVSVCAVVFAGTVSLRLAEVAALGPLLVTTWV
jgi:hypothetical protein